MSADERPAAAPVLGPRMQRLVHDVREAVDPEFDVRWAGALPWNPLARPLREARIALAGTGAVHRRGDEPFRCDFEPLGDTSWRELPHDAEPGELALDASYVDERFVRHDPEVAFPRRALDRLVTGGRVGSAAARHFAFAPGVVRPLPGLARSAAEVAERARADSIDAVVLAPT